MITKQRLLNFILNKTTVIITYISIALLIAILKYSLGEPNSHINNYIIFKSSFKHFSEGLNLYSFYPKEYFDLFLYGPLFSLFIAPFAIMPVILGVSAWNVLNGVLFLYAIYELPDLSNSTKGIIAWITLNSCITSFSNVQFHGITAALIILSYTNIKKGKESLAAFHIVLGSLLKLYGIVGLAFFFFSKNKPKLIFWGFAWSILLLLLPLSIGSFNYLMQSYKDWFEILRHENTVNVAIENMCTDFSVMGMVRRLSSDPTISSMFFIIPVIIVFGFSFLRYKYFDKTNFQLLILSSVLLLPVLASTGTEASTLLIGFVGVTIWYVISKKQPIDHFLFFFALIFSSFGPTDLMPKFFRDEYLRKYALMALPMFMVWLKINYEILFDYKNKEVETIL